MDNDGDEPVTASSSRSTENIAECKKAVLRLLSGRVPQQRVGPGATAGWLEDRSIGFTEYAINTALRNLASEKKVVRSTDGGFVYWQILTPEVAEQMKKRRARFGAKKAT